MLIKLRKGKRAQSLVIVALSATALFGIIALGLDAGRLYFQRRDVQNAADAGALAGAQELLPTGSNTTVTSAMIDSAGCQASVYALLGLLDTGRFWIKLSAPYETSKVGGPGYDDVTRMARAFVRANPQRCLWASNWPHPNTNPQPSNAAMLDLLLDWVDDEATRTRILVDNPAALYGYG